MKKAIVLLAVLLCAFTVFASKNSLSLNFVPFAVQIKTSSIDAEDSIHSKYGIGAELSYQRFIVKGLYAELGFGWDTFLLKGDRSAETNLMVFGGLGYKCRINEKFSSFVHVNLAEDSVFYRGKGQAALGVKTGVGLSCNICNNFEITALCDGTFSFCKDSKAKYVDYRILPMIGASYKF